MGYPAQESLSRSPSLSVESLSMPTYEYRTVPVRGETVGLRRRDPEVPLNELGAERFRAVEQIHQQFGGTQLLVLMREVPE
jgi:hypothetical protein